MRVARAGHVAHHGRQVEAQHALIFSTDQSISPQAGGFGVVLDQRHLLRLTPGKLEIVDGLLIDVEHRRRCAVLRAHIGDGCTVTDGQAVCAFAEELDPGADHPLLAQKLGQRQDDIGGGNPRLTLAGQFNADDIGQAHHRRQAEHHGLGFQATDTDGDHAQRIDVRSVRVGANAGVWERNAATCLDHRTHFLQVDLVHDAVAGRDHVDVLERRLGPLDKVKAVLVAALLDGAVLLERIRIKAGEFHGQRMIDDQLGRHHRVDLGRIAPLLSDGITQTSQVDQSGLAENVVTHHPRRVPGKIQVLLALD